MEKKMSGDTPQTILQTKNCPKRTNFCSDGRTFRRSSPIFLVSKIGSMSSLLQTVEILWALPWGVLCTHVTKCIGDPTVEKIAIFFPQETIFWATRRPIWCKNGYISSKWHYLEISVGDFCDFEILDFFRHCKGILRSHFGPFCPRMPNLKTPNRPKNQKIKNPLPRSLYNVILKLSTHFFLKLAIWWPLKLFPVENWPFFKVWHFLYILRHHMSRLRLYLSNS